MATINDVVLRYTDEQITNLTDADAKWLASGLQYFDPFVAGITITPRYHEAVALLRARAALVAPKPTPKAAPRQPAYPNGRKLDCGHIVYETAEVLRASLGTSCQDCYDRMS